MKKPIINFTNIYVILREVLITAIERAWIPLSIGVNRHSLSSFDIAIKNQMPSQIVFVPYGTPACRFQHKSLAAHIQRNGQASSVVMAHQIFKESDNENSFQDLKFDSFADLLKGIIKLCQGDLIFATGAVDSFMAMCPSKTFFGNFIVPKDFIELIHATKIQAQDFVFGCSAIVLADGAGLHNRALISSALNTGKRVYVFNPDGDWLEFTHQHGENHRDFENYLKKLSPNAYDSALAEANTYLDARFKGKQTDIDSPGVFLESENSIEEGPKKVLFMHVFRDPNQVQLDPESDNRGLFSSYFEWADFCLREVAKNPDDWRVKLHPSSKFFANEIEIQLQLLAKHGISMDLVDSCPTTAQVLQNRWPIYTFSGTIALESAVFGYRSHVCSSRHPEQLVHIARSESQLMEHLREPPNQIAEPLKTLDNEMARLLLHWVFKHDLVLLSPKNPQPDKRSHFTFQVSTLLQEISLMGRYLKASVQVQLQKMALEIINNLN